MLTARKGLLVAGLHVALVLSLGGKLLYDRAVRPRVWAQSAPVDPDLPIRGRYVQLRIAVDAADPAMPDFSSVALRAENGRLIAVRDPNQGDPLRASGLHARVRTRNGQREFVLEEPLAFFIPEKVEDPSLREQGEELWVEVTLPKKGPPRPIRLGVKKGDGPITPLALD